MHPFNQSPSNHPVQAIGSRPANYSCLLVSYNFPPFMSPHSLRWYYLTKELAFRGHRVDVLTIKMPDRFVDNAYSTPVRVRTHRTFPGFFFDLTFRFSTEQVIRNPLAVESSGMPRRQRLQMIHAWLVKCCNAFLVPDLYVEWFPFALHQAQKLITDHRYDVLISTSEPRIGHLLGLAIKTIAHIPWIADYGDPWIYPVSYSYEPCWKKRILTRLETFLLRRVDAVTVTTEATRDLYLQRYPFLTEKHIHVVPQGFDQELLASIVPLTSRHFRIVYCGSWYKHLRDPEPFLNALALFQSAKDLEVIVAGRINEYAETIRRKPYSSKLRHLGFVHHHSALALEKGATILLHIGNAGQAQVPGKIYEYFGANRPILAIAAGSDDASAALVAKAKRGLVVPNDTAAILDALQKLYRWWQQGELDSHFDLQCTARFSWQDRARELDRLLSLVTAWPEPAPGSPTKNGENKRLI